MASKGRSREADTNTCGGGGVKNNFHYKETQTGFEWGPCKINRWFSDPKKGWITLGLTTKRYPRGVQIYVTPTGYIRVSTDKKFIKL